MVDGSLVVSLSAPFGSGKSTFLEIWRESISSRRLKDSGACPVVVSVNAWKNDHILDPLLSVLLSMIEALENIDSKHACQLKRSVEALAAFLSVGSSALIESALERVPGGRAVIAGWRAAVAASDKTKGGSVLDGIRQRQKLLDEIRHSLSEVFGRLDGVKTYVFVDELDRCRPDYAISYLEAIKHFFDIKGMVFVLCVDEGQLASAAKAVFGIGLDFDEYFRKFSHRSVRLPLATSLSETVVSDYVRVTIDRFFKGSSSGAPAAFINRKDAEVYLAELILALEVTPRQVESALRVIAHARLTPQSDSRGSDYIYDVRLVLMALLRATNRPLYERFGKEPFCLSELDHLCSRLKKQSKVADIHSLQHRFKIYGLGFDTSSPEFVEALSKLLPKYFPEGDPGHKQAMFFAEIPNGRPRFSSIYNHIEGLMTFG